MDKTEMEQLITEMHTDIKWIKQYIADLNKFKLAAIIAIIVAILGVIVR